MSYFGAQKKFDLFANLEGADKFACVKADRARNERDDDFRISGERSGETVRTLSRRRDKKYLSTVVKR